MFNRDMLYDRTLFYFVPPHTPLAYLYIYILLYYVSTINAFDVYTFYI